MAPAPSLSANEQQAHEGGVEIQPAPAPARPSPPAGSSSFSLESGHCPEPGEDNRPIRPNMESEPQLFWEAMGRGQKMERVVLCILEAIENANADNDGPR